MISPEEIKRKALRIYSAFLNSWLLNEVFFPIVIPGNKGKPTDPIIERKKDLERLLEKSKEKKGKGYSLFFKEVNTRQTGTQSIISKITFETPEDYLHFINKESEFRDFKKSTAILRKKLPEINPFLRELLKELIENQNRWNELILVCRYMIEHPKKNHFVRELPIEVHTKFIEENSSVLKKLLDRLLPPEAVNRDKNSFEERYFLKCDKPLIRFRFLEAGAGIEGLKDLAIPAEDFAALNPKIKKLFIVENKMTFLTFPRAAESLCVWGMGFGVEMLKTCSWLQDKKIYYWGDIDPPGFEILSAFRNSFPHARSLMMDRETYDRFKEFAHSSKIRRICEKLNLTPEEQKIYYWLTQNPHKNRLEQERITQDYIKIKVEKILFDE